jgi:Cu/Ag efflux protein CusF
VKARALLRLIATVVLITGFSVSAQEAANRYPFAKGTIEKVDAAAKRVTVATPSGSRTFALTERTYVYRGKEKIGLDKLKIGDATKINYYTNETGQAFIRRLKIDQPEPPEERAPR